MVNFKKICKTPDELNTTLQNENDTFMKNIESFKGCQTEVPKIKVCIEISIAEITKEKTDGLKLRTK